MRYKVIILTVFVLTVAIFAGCSRNLELSDPRDLSLQGDLLFVCNTSSNYVSVIDANSNLVIASIEARQPWGITFSEDEKKGYISCVVDGQLEVVNGFDFMPFDYINVGYSSPVGVVVISSLNRAYVVCYASDSLRIVDLNENEWIGEADLEDVPQWVAVSSDESKVYVVNTKSDTVSVVDVAVEDVSKTISVPYYPYGIKLSPHDNKIYVGCFGYISIIDPVNDVLEESLYLGGGTKSWVEFSNVSRYAYISDLSLDKVIVYDLVDRQVIEEIPVDDRPHCMARNSDGSKIFVSCPGSNTIAVINTLTNTVEAKIPVGNNPIGLCFRD